MVATLFVGCLPYRFSESDVSRLFTSICEVRSVEYFSDWEGATLHAYAQVEIEADDIEAVIKAMDGKKVKNMPLMVHRLVQHTDNRVFLERLQ